MRLSAVLPPEAIADIPRAVLTGNKKLLIEGHKGLILCDIDRICIRLPQGRMDVHGSNLTIASLSIDDLIITGTINRLELMP